jgi:hypothetical protein
MTKILSLVFVSALALNAQAAEKDAKYFTLTKVKMTDVTEQYAAKNHQLAQVGLYEDCNQNQGNVKPFDNTIPGISLDPLDQANIILDKIVNLGKKVWALVETGRPVVNITTYTANALPAGLQCWSDLSGWQIPQSKVYRVQYENAYGMNVVDFAYRVTFTAGGNLNGHGKFLTNATIAPANLNVSWGFNLTANAEVPSVFNMGTKEDPVAGMQMLMKWNIKTVMNHVEQAETFYVGGDNTMKHME